MWTLLEQNSRIIRLALAGLALAGWAVIVVLSVLPGSARPHTGAGGMAEHAIAYGCVALFGGCATASTARRLGVGAGLTLTAAALEIIQFFIPGRTSEVPGFISGAAGGWLPILALWALQQQLKGHSTKT